MRYILLSVVLLLVGCGNNHKTITVDAFFTDLNSELYKGIDKSWEVSDGRGYIDFDDNPWSSGGPPVLPRTIGCVFFELRKPYQLLRNSYQLRYLFIYKKLNDTKRAISFLSGIDNRKLELYIETKKYTILTYDLMYYLKRYDVLETKDLKEQLQALDDYLKEAISKYDN